MMNEAIAAALFASFAVAVGFTALLVRYGPALGFVDIPNERSSHTRPTPRGGGLAIGAGVAVGVLALSAGQHFLGRGLASLLIASAALVAIGAFDDRESLPRWFRLVAHALVAAALVSVVGPVDRLPLPGPLDISLGWLGWPLTLLWLVAVTNFFNFMDGIDGLAAGQAIASCIGIAIAAWSLDAQLLALVLVAATLGFLVFNRPPAKIFLGDAGSTSIGFTIAAVPLLATPQARPMATLAVGIGLSLFLLDPLETLFRLVRTGHPVGTAHRQHSYQRLARASGNPAIVSAGIFAFSLALSVGAGLAYGMHMMFWVMLVIAGLIFVFERFVAGRWRASLVRSNGERGSPC